MYLKVKWMDPEETEIMSFPDKEAAQNYLRANTGEYDPETVVFSNNTIFEGLTVWDLLLKLLVLGRINGDRPIYLDANGKPLTKVEVDGSAIRLY